VHRCFRAAKQAKQQGGQQEQGHSLVGAEQGDGVRGITQREHNVGERLVGASCDQDVVLRLAGQDQEAALVGHGKGGVGHGAVRSRANNGMNGKCAALQLMGRGKGAQHHQSTLGRGTAS